MSTSEPPGLRQKEIVAYELYVNAKESRTRNLVTEFIRPMERTGG